MASIPRMRWITPLVATWCLLVPIALLAGCETTVQDPMTALADKSAHDRTHLKSIQMMRERNLDDDPIYLDLLAGIVWRPGYGLAVRREALNELWAHDREQTILLLRRQLPRMTNWPWLTEW